LVAEVKANLPVLHDYEPNIEEINPIATALKRFGAAVSHINHPAFVDEAVQNLKEQLEQLWQFICSRNETFGEQICESKTEYNDIVKFTREGPLAIKGLLSRLRVTRKRCEVESRTVSFRKRGGEPVYSEWHSTGVPVTHFEESSLEGIGQLPRLEARLLKRNPSLWEAVLSLGTRLYVERCCMLRDGHFLWWEPGKENEPGEGGCINLFLQSAVVETESGLIDEDGEEVEREPSGCTYFEIKPAEGDGWEDDSSFTRGKFRTFMLKSIHSDDSLGEWITGLRQHIEFCRKVREQLGRKRLEDELGVRKYRRREV